MNLNAITNQSSLISSLYGTDSTSEASNDVSQILETNSVGHTTSDSIDFSKPGELFSKLKELQQADPEKFKQVCADIAQKLKSASQDQSGFGSKMLSDLAEKFQNVADGGDISQLQPPPPPQGFPAGGQSVNAYGQQTDKSVIEMLKNQHDKGGPNSEMSQLIDSIMQEVQKALAA
jgi:hypothetical protein